MNSLPIIIALAAAAAVAVLVLVAVLVARHRRASAADEEPAGSFLGSRPQDTFAGLGEPESSTATDDEFRLDWGHGGGDVAAAAAPAARHDETTMPHEDEPADRHASEPAAATGAEAAARTADEPTGDAEPAGSSTAAGAPPAAVDDAGAEELTEVPVAEPEADDVTPASEAVLDSVAEVEEVTEVPVAECSGVAGSGPVAGAQEGAAAAVIAGGGAAPETPGDEAPARRMVPLSDIIVTTSRKMVDLDDPEVRRMLTELVRYEIDQASEFSAAGQTVDAILQLTEAEKVSRTLGMDETASRIKTMMRELRD